jgi:release factor glutamine methyltransferase
MRRGRSELGVPTPPAGWQNPTAAAGCTQSTEALPQIYLVISRHPDKLRATSGMTTVLETIDGGTRYLEKRGIEDARRNMQMLVAARLGCTRMDLYLRFDHPVAESDLVPLREALKKRGEGIPLQHLLGRVYFHKHEFKTDARALIPRPETEELAEWILKWELPPQGEILDMGCGSGVLGLTLAAALPAWNLTLADVSPDALALARENAADLEIPNAAFLESDLFAAVAGPFDGIVANLPYVPESDRASLSREVMHDPALALFSGRDGLDLIRRFIPDAFHHLKPGGWLVMEIGHDQNLQVSEMLHAAGFTGIEVKTDLSGIARFPLAKRP